MADVGEEGYEPEEEKSDLSVEQKEEIMEYFGVFDKENTDQIEVANLGPLLRSLRFNPTESELIKLVQQYDKHSSNKLTKKQIFEIVANKLKDTDTIEELVEAMKLFDLDKDGKIEVKELRWAMTQLG